MKKNKLINVPQSKITLWGMLIFIGIFCVFLVFAAEGDYIESFSTSSQCSSNDCLGIASNASNLFVVDQTQHEVYIYNHSGTYASSFDTSVQTNIPHGITTDNTNIWVVDGGDKEVYKYDMVGNSISNFDTSTCGDNGITVSGISLYILDKVRKQVCNYSTAGTYTSNFSIAEVGDDPMGITIHGSNIWIVEYDKDVIHKYDTSGNYVSNFSATADNTVGTGITTDGDYFWIVDKSKQKVYKYEGPGVIVGYISINLTAPKNNTEYSATALNFTANYSVTNYNLTNTTYHVWDSTGDVYNNSVIVTITGTTNGTIEVISDLSLGHYEWNVLTCYENSSWSNCSSATANYSFTIGASIDTQSYPITSYETDNETFTANITLISGANLYATRLVYNGTEYLATKTSIGTNQYELERTIDVPLLTEGLNQNLSFYWQFEYLNADIIEQNSSISEHEVKNLSFDDCTTHPEKFLNITVFNETTKDLLNTTLDASFDFWLGSGTVIKNYSLDSTFDHIEYNFCSNQNETLTVDAIMEATKTIYEDRTFYFNNERYSNTTNHTKLYLINSSLISDIIVQVRDAGLSPLENYYAKIKRYYPEDNTYETIERPKTDAYGQFVAKLVENDVKYKFLFYDSDNNLKKETGDMSIACRTTICILPFVIEDITSDVERFENLTDYDYSLSFDNSINKFTFSWNDVSGKTATMRLLVTRYLWNGTTTICNTTSTQRAYVLTCSVGNQSASYQAIAFRRVSGETERRIAQISAKVGIEWETFGTEGLIWSFFLLFTMIAIGYWYPPVGIVLYLFGIGLLMYTNIIYISPAILFAQLAIGVAFIWAFHRRTTA